MTAIIGVVVALGLISLACLRLGYRWGKATQKELCACKQCPELERLRTQLANIRQAWYEHFGWEAQREKETQRFDNGRGKRTL